MVPREQTATTTPQCRHGTDGILKEHTAKGIYTFLVEQKKWYLDQRILNGLIGRAKQSDQKPHAPLLLLSRFLPNSSAQRLISYGRRLLAHDPWPRWCDSVDAWIQHYAPALLLMQQEPFCYYPGSVHAGPFDDTPCGPIQD